MLNDEGPNLYSPSEAGPCTSQSDVACAHVHLIYTSCQAPIKTLSSIYFAFHVDARRDRTYFLCYTTYLDLFISARMMPASSH